MLDVRRMQLLRAVVTSGSVTAAARNLGYTPSAVSQQMAALEKEAGIALLERSGRGVRPTDAGRLLNEYATLIGDHVAEAETALADLRAGRTGRVAVRYFASAGAALVAPALARLRSEHPGVQTELKLSEPEDPLPEVRDGRADLALVVRPHGGPPVGGIRFVPLLDDRFLAVLPEGHRLAAQDEIELSGLADEPWIRSDRPGPCLDPVLDACASAGFSPGFVVESEDHATARAFVAAGLGIALIPELGTGGPHPGVAVRRVRGPEPVRSIHAAVRESSPAGQPALRGLLDALRATAAAVPGQHLGPATGPALRGVRP
ncbi:MULTISPECIES: LysR family transcriptional regulator [unclassified Streptomyces]|uniref:LysR family transcriptional regulator n=1 Tax=unclassified Streptomyces TaxID=2593676 RepID=UPI002E36FF5A|nr:LysR family transcriptional regulator [Streptomyces sp. NBC_01708]